jgi:hypothetical protein
MPALPTTHTAMLQCAKDRAGRRGGNFVVAPPASGATNGSDAAPPIAQHC